VANGGAGCDLCDRVARLPQPASISDLRKRDRAELKEAEPLPDLSAPRAAATALGFRKRHRVMDKRRFG
jgi:hypothetical protein